MMSKKLKPKGKFKKKCKDNKSEQTLIPQCMYDEVKESCTQFYEEKFHKNLNFNKHEEEL